MPQSSGRLVDHGKAGRAILFVQVFREDRVRHKELGKEFNQRGATLHLCLTGERLCEVERENPSVR